MKIFRPYHTNKAAKLIAQIIANEDLNVKVFFKTNALGDDIIEVKGENEEIDTLVEIFEMVY